MSYIPKRKKPIFKNEYKKKCSVCGISFITVYKRQNICNNFNCSCMAARERAIIIMREKRKKINSAPCQVCGFIGVSDIHHEMGKIYKLCPNHHALITRGIKTLFEVLAEKNI